MKNILMRRVVAVLALTAFGFAMAMLDFLPSVVTRALLAAVAQGFACIAYVCASRRGAYQSTLRHRVMIVLSVIGFAVAMAARGELSSFYARILLGGVAGSFQGIAFIYGFRRVKPWLFSGKQARIDGEIARFSDEARRNATDEP